MNFKKISSHNKFRKFRKIIKLNKIKSYKRNFQKIKNNKIYIIIILRKIFKILIILNMIILEQEFPLVKLINLKIAKITKMQTKKKNTLLKNNKKISITKLVKI
jgi:hypothetical protein